MRVGDILQSKYGSAIFIVKQVGLYYYTGILSYNNYVYYNYKFNEEFLTNYYRKMENLDILKIMLDASN